VTILYPTLEQVISMHEKTVIVSGGGTVGIRDDGPLQGTLAHIQNDDYYPTLDRKLARLFFALAKFHCFVDGNKRIAITATSIMLMLNGYLAIVPRFMRDMENISVLVADGTISEEFLHEIVCAHTAFDPDNEDVKLKLFDLLSATEAANNPHQEQ
jgi:death on curing protein